MVPSPSARHALPRRRHCVVFVVFCAICAWVGASLFYYSTTRLRKRESYSPLQDAGLKEAIVPFVVDVNSVSLSGPPSPTDTSQIHVDEQGDIHHPTLGSKKLKVKGSKSSRTSKSAVVDAPVVDVSSSLIAPRQQYATIVTDHGMIFWQLHAEEAPITVGNIVRMSRIGVFNDSCFYRYEKGFVLQGGLHCNQRKTKTKGAKTVPLEYKIPNGKLTVALARAGSDTKSGGTEFFINLADNSRGLGPGKKGGYAVFATVIGSESVATIQRLKQLKTVKKGLTIFVDPQPVIHHIRISDTIPEGIDGTPKV